MGFAAIAFGADVVLSVALHQSATGLRDAHTVTMEPLLAAVAADHEPKQTHP